MYEGVGGGHSPAVVVVELYSIATVVGDGGMMALTICRQHRHVNVTKIVIRVAVDLKHRACLCTYKFYRRVWSQIGS